MKGNILFYLNPAVWVWLFVRWIHGLLFGRRKYEWDRWDHDNEDDSSVSTMDYADWDAYQSTTSSSSSSSLPPVVGRSKIQITLRG